MLARLQEMPHVGAPPPGKRQASHEEQKKLRDDMVQRGLWQRRWLFSVELGLLEASEQI